MSKNEVKVKPPWIILNQNKLQINTALIRRLVRVDYPVYRFPVEITERSSEPYQEIEKNMELIIDYTDIKNRKELFETMGIGDLDILGNNVIDYLMSIGHIEENGSLKLTALGKESLKNNNKIKQERSARVIYFDALSLEPLPHYFYKAKGSKFLTPKNEGDFFFSNVIDVWDDFAIQKLHRLLEYDGEKRFERNLPQEMIDIDLSNEVREKYEEIGQGYVWYLPLYILVLDTVTDFKKKMMKKAIYKLNFKIINAVNGQEAPFFENLFRENFKETKCILQPLIEDYNPLQEADRVSMWKQKLSDIESLNKYIFTEDQNLLLNVSDERVITWIDNDKRRALLDIAYDNLVTIDNDRAHHGRIARLKTSEAIEEKAIGYLLKKEEERLKKQDKSEEYILREKKKLLERIIDIRNGDCLNNQKKDNHDKPVKININEENNKQIQEDLHEGNHIIDKLQAVESINLGELMSNIRENNPKEEREVAQVNEFCKRKRSIVKKVFGLIKIASILLIVALLLEKAEIIDIESMSSKHTIAQVVETIQTYIPRRNKVGFVTQEGSGVFARTGPHQNYDKITQYYYRRELEIYAEEKGINSTWYKIYIDTNNYQGYGWVCGELGDKLFIKVQ